MVGAAEIHQIQRIVGAVDILQQQTDRQTNGRRFGAADIHQRENWRKIKFGRDCLWLAAG